MIDHTGIGVADVTRSAAFYDAILGALGWRRVAQCRRTPASKAWPTAWTVAALRAGGKDNGSPGLRDTATGYPPGYYAAFVLDPDGNNMEAVFRERL